MATIFGIPPVKIRSDMASGGNNWEEKSIWFDTGGWEIKNMTAYVDQGSSNGSYSNCYTINMEKENKRIMQGNKKILSRFDCLIL